MWKLDHKEGWVLKNWCFQIMVLEKILQSPLDCKEIQPVHSKGDQSWVFFGRNDAKAETPVLWPPHEKTWLFGKDRNAGKDWRQEEKQVTEDETVGWHHRVNGHEFEQAPGVGDGQGSLACCSPWGHKELNMTNWTTTNTLNILYFVSIFWQLKLLCLKWRPESHFPVRKRVGVAKREFADLRTFKRNYFMVRLSSKTT